MRAGKVIAVVLTIMIGAPAVAGAQDRADDRVRQDAAALPERLWESAADPVSAAGPGLSEDDGGGVAPLLAGAILLVSVGAGYGLGLLRPAAEPEPAPVPSTRVKPATRLLAGDAETCVIALTTRAGGEEAEFVALARDESGNAQVMARSPRFARRAGLAVEETESAVAAHGRLIEDLEAHGWHVSGTLETWYGATLARRRPA